MLIPERRAAILLLVQGEAYNRHQELSLKALHAHACASYQDRSLCKLKQNCPLNFKSILLGASSVGL